MISEEDWIVLSVVLKVESYVGQTKSTADDDSFSDYVEENSFVNSSLAHLLIANNRDSKGRSVVVFSNDRKL